MSDPLRPEGACVVSQGWSEAEPLEIDRILIISPERALFVRWINARPSRAMESKRYRAQGFRFAPPLANEVRPFRARTELQQ